MMMLLFTRGLVVTVLVLGSLNACLASRILVVAPTYATSHFRMVQPLIEELIKSGHELTVVSFYPRVQPHPNYTDIDLRPVKQPYTLDFEAWSLLNDIYELFEFSSSGCDEIFGSEPVQNLLKSGSKFDAIILEAFACDAILGFPAFYKAPFIAFSPMALPAWIADWVWNPTDSSYIPDQMCRSVEANSMYERMFRSGCQFISRLANWWLNTRPSINIVKKHFRLNLESLEDIKSNVSLIFENSLPGLSGIRPRLPNVIPIGGIHLKPQKPIPNVSSVVQ